MTLQSEDMGKLVAGPDGWIEWSGGPNPVPGQEVEFRIRVEQKVLPAPSETLRWHHWGHRDDIIAFRPAHREAQPENDGGGEDYESAWLNAEAQLSEISAALGSGSRFMDPPDGGSVTLAEQVRRMRVALETAEAPTPEGQTEGAVEAARKALEVIAAASERSETMFGGKMSDVTRVFQNISRVSREALAALASKGV